MNFEGNITLKAYADEANQQFNSMQNRLEEMESSFEDKMNGRTTNKLTLSFIGTIAWAILLIVGAIFAFEVTETISLIVSVIVVLALLAVMMLDTIMSYSYYGTIDTHKNSIAQLRNRVIVGRSSIQSNHDAFLGSKSRSWNFFLNMAPSIPDEAKTIESTVANMESLKKGIINILKNALYFASAVAVTITGGLAFFEMGEEIIGMGGDAFETSIDSETCLILNLIGLAIAVALEVFLAKVVWSKSSCSVNNVTLFIMLLGPVLYLAVVAIATLLIVAIIYFIAIAISLAIAAGGIALACACLCGG